jgi:hypothetical protein
VSDPGDRRPLVDYATPEPRARRRAVVAVVDAVLVALAVLTVLAVLTLIFASLAVLVAAMVREL